MVKTLLIIVSFGFTLHLVAQTGMEKGLEFLGQKDFTHAIQAFQEEINTSPSSEAYYNLGIAYVGKGEAVYALWAFESALKYNPSSSKAAHNARVLYTDLHSEQNWVTPYNLSTRIVTYLAASSWMMLAFFFSLITAMALFFVLAKPRHPQQTTFRALLIVGVVLLVCSVLAYTSNKSHYSNETYAIVKYSEAQFFIGKDGVPATTQFNLGDRLKFVTCDEDWCSVETNEGDVYWVESNQLLRY